MQYKFNYLFSWPLSLEHQSRPLCQTVGPLEYSSERRTQSPSLETYRKDLAIGSLPLAPADNRDAWSHLNNEWKWSSIYGQLLWFKSQLCTGVFFSISKILMHFSVFLFQKKLSTEIWKCYRTYEGIFLIGFEYFVYLIQHNTLVYMSHFEMHNYIA